LVYSDGILLGDSVVRWRYISEDGGTPRLDLVEWHVLPEHEADFSDLRAVFEEQGQTVPTPAVSE
jgi:hypothetical protein